MSEQSKKITEFIISQKPQTKAEFDNAKRKICSVLKIAQPSNRQLIKCYQDLLKKKSIKQDKQIEQLLKKAEIRTLSGIAVVTSLTKPYPCPGKCIYCPQEKGMPKSYLASEPAAARAFKLNFNPYEQMQKRILTLEANGHPTDKIEFIVKGGTWNAYPLKYQYWFILESFKACNNFKKLKVVVPTQYKDWKIKRLKDLQKTLEKEQTYNETANHRIIGLTLETRPDAVTHETIFHMRQQGCTRIELGLQASDDKILKLVKRGHTVEQFKNAMLLLRSAGFKVDLHFMPGLPGSTSKHDVEMYKKLFTDPGLKPDMVKIYPCTVIKNSPLYAWLKSGKYKPYDNKKLFEALIQMKLATPRYCRISRLIRDIPAGEIKGGNIITNLRENLQREMKKRELRCQCLRCREIGHRVSVIPAKAGIQSLNDTGFPIMVGNDKQPTIFTEKYETTGGTEYFLSFEDVKRTTVFAFLRLRLCHAERSPDSQRDSSPAFREERGRNDSVCFIRELHVYGELIPLQHDSTSARQHTRVQHKGLGKKLMAEAERIAKKNNRGKIAVISGVGVREYYRKLGYIKNRTYMIKKI
ncbi:MAG: tRNA uridine(34) 5-carboxymethylaminomethyl modification radical SAM/GNAT enzyme Elp3 [Patescibacteria group bacterium]